MKLKASAKCALPSKKNTAGLLILLVLLSVSSDAALPPPAVRNLAGGAANLSGPSVSGAFGAAVTAAPGLSGPSVSGMSASGPSVSGGEAVSVQALGDFYRMDEQQRAASLSSLYLRPVPETEGQTKTAEAGQTETEEAEQTETAEAEQTGEAEPGTAPAEESAETGAEPDTGPETAGGEPVETQAADDPLYKLGDSPEKRVRLFGGDGTWFPSGEAAAERMTDVEVPVWELDREGGRQSGTMRVRVNAALAEDVRTIFQAVYEDPEQFPVESMGGFVWRDRNPWSEHCSGSAIDLNPDQNFQVRDGNAMTGSYWKPGEDPRSVTVGGSVVRAFAEYGWSWGGDAWAGYSDQSTGYHDYMHFSYLGR